MRGQDRAAWRFAQARQSRGDRGGVEHQRLARIERGLDIARDGDFRAIAASALGVLATIDELAERVEALHARATRAEGELGRSNPPLFQAVQLVGGTDLERVRDQMKLLKR